MAVVVEGLKLPWACIACPFRVYRASDEVSLCVATNQNGVDYATPVELPSYDGRSSFCPLKEQPEEETTRFVLDEFVVKCEKCQKMICLPGVAPNIATLKQQEWMFCPYCGRAAKFE